MGAITDGNYQNYYDPMLGQKLPLVFDAKKEFVSNSIFGITTGLVSGDLLNPIKTLGSIFCGIGKKSASPTETTPAVQQSEETSTEESVEDTTNELKSFLKDFFKCNILNKSDVKNLVKKYGSTSNSAIIKMLENLQKSNTNYSNESTKVSAYDINKKQFGLHSDIV